MLDAWWQRRLASLTRSQARAWGFIAEYVRATGRPCFTYNQLQRYWPRARTRINVNTLERRLRELAELGILHRSIYIDGRGRRRVRFCLPPALKQELLGGGMVRGC